jgi:hypothetical protein
MTEGCCYTEGPPTRYAFRSIGQTQSGDWIASVLVGLSQDLAILAQFADSPTPVAIV